MSKFDLRDELVERRKIGTYVSCNYTTKTVNNLLAWCTDNSIPEPLAKRHYHSTILYSRKSIFDAHQIVNMFDESAELAVIGFKLFDSIDQTFDALVLELSAPLLISLHQRLIKAGGTHDYPDYTPHLTVSYRAPKNFNLSLLKLPDFKLIVNKFKVEPLDLDWKD